MKHWLVAGTALILVVVVSFVAIGARRADAASSVVGTWKLLSYKSNRSDGSSVDLYGAAPLGQLIYDSSGHMSVHLLAPDLAKCGSMDRRKCPDLTARAAFDNYLGYWGRYKVSADGKSVVHRLDGASTPDWVGTSQERFIELSGNRLTITTPLQQIGGIESRQVLTWERETVVSQR
jgi:hypothetical protein